MQARRMPTFIGSRVVILPAILFTGSLGNRVRRRLPESSIFAQLEDSVREIRDSWGVTKEWMASIVPESWSECGLRIEGG